MGLSPLRILILEDVPMDAELVEYELERARIPVHRPAGGHPGSVPRTSWRPSGPTHPLRLHPSPLRRHGGALAGAGAGPDVPFLIVTGSVNEETAVGCMKAGATDYLLKSNLARIGPAIEGALARVQARTEKARAEAALRRSEANLRAIFNNSLQAFVLIDRDGTIQALNSTAVEWSARLLGRAAEGGLSGSPTSSPRRWTPSARRWPERPATSSGCFRDADGVRALVRDHPRSGGGRAGQRHRRLPQRPGDQHAEAGRAGAAGERGALPRPVRQRQRPGLRHRSPTARSST